MRTSPGGEAAAQELSGVVLPAAGRSIGSDEGVAMDIAEAARRTAVSRGMISYVRNGNHPVPAATRPPIRRVVVEADRSPDPHERPGAGAAPPSAH